MTTVGSIVMNSDTDIYDSQKMNWNNFGNPVTFHLLPPSCQKFHLSNTRFMLALTVSPVAAVSSCN